MAFPRPTILPVWAVQDQIDVDSLQNNVLTPPVEMQQYGWQRLQFPPRNWFNWLARYTYQWLAYLSQQDAQSTATSDNTGATPIVDVVNGGMALIFVIDTTTPANYYEGITYIPPAYGGGTSFTTIASSTLTVGTIAANGGVIVSGGSGSYIVYGQMKTA